MQSTRMRFWSLAAGVASLIVVVSAVLAYARLPAIAAAVVALPLLSVGRPWQRPPQES